MANNSNDPKLDPKDAIAVAGGVTAQMGPIIGAIVGSLLVADLCVFGGMATAMIALALKGDEE